MAVSTSSTNNVSSPLVAPAVPPTSANAAKMNAKNKSEPSELVLATSAVPVDAQVWLDEWLANDLQQTGLLADAADIPSLFSSPEANGSSDSVFLGESPPAVDIEMAAQPLFNSPQLDNLSPIFSPTSSSSTSPGVSPPNIFEASPILDAGMNFFPDLDTPRVVRSLRRKSKLETPKDAFVAQLAAAGAFNIPWGTEPAPRQLPLHPVDPVQQAAAIAAAQAAAEFRLTGAQVVPGGAGHHHQPHNVSKRRTVDLDEIDMNDEAAVKRAKNTDAARRSRMKKVMKMEGLERRVSELEGENSKLVLKVAVLESEKAGHEARELEYERRIKRLEEQIREAHNALVECRSSKD